MKQTIATPNATTPAQPGRPSGYSPEIAGHLRAVIRKTGRSDSAAAALAGVSTSSLSRWKNEFPHLRLLLLQAREEFRQDRLDTILRASQAEGSGAWRAAAWLLVHVFPEDYSPKAAEREKFQQLAAQQEIAEAAPETAVSAEEYSEEPSHNSRNSLLSAVLEAAPASGAPAGRLGQSARKAVPAPQAGPIAAAVTVTTAQTSW